MTRGYQATEEEIHSVLDWFGRWDALAVAKDVEALADLSYFPVNAVTDGSARIWDRERFLVEMGKALAGSGTMESERTPVFVNANLVVVFTDAVFTFGDDSVETRYADILIKVDGDWRFQTMAQGGW
ncbi:nuclear transport factor 2 family protein [Saccharothrix violaceirubra]|uniref:Nuclear transport factor 2 family protein n=1 Tax=Saccharothrix violaceirubra TaxID=413306 RepID=A0A7W7T6E6_9PSEU|nr:nuclear transport factor 2 family protein [Saccharothrix violaceirubra]MBB4967181.1 hypothetical protein [Saccharothrix violaceirubra]